MTKTPDREIRELTAELYARLGCAGAPRAKTAKLLEQIDLAADRLVQERDEAIQRRDDALDYAGWLDRSDLMDADE